MWRYPIEDGVKWLEGLVEHGEKFPQWSQWATTKFESRPGGEERAGKRRSWVVDMDGELKRETWHARGKWDCKAGGEWKRKGKEKAEDIGSWCVGSGEGGMGRRL